MFLVLKQAIRDFKDHMDATDDEIMVVIGQTTVERLNNPAVNDPENITHVFGIELYIDKRIPDGAFGICWKSCKDHIDDHIEDLLKELPAWIQCDLCGHPLSTELAVGDDITCLWCGDVNDLDDLLGDDE
jgi:hypothetical protein